HPSSPVQQGGGNSTLRSFVKTDPLSSKEKVRACVSRAPERVWRKASRRAGNCRLRKIVHCRATLSEDSANNEHPCYRVSTPPQGGLYPPPNISERCQHSRK